MIMRLMVMMMMILERVRRRVAHARVGRQAAGEESEERTVEGFLEGEPKLGRHQLIEQRVYRRAQVVGDAGHVGELMENVHDELVLVARLGQVAGEQALRVKGNPADEEGDHDGDCVCVG